MLFDQMGLGDAEWSKKLGSVSYSLFFMTMEKLLKTKKKIIIENNFNPKTHGQIIKELLVKYEYESMEIFLEADSVVILNRHKRRWESGERHRGHADNERFEEYESKLKDETARPLNVSENIIRIDTSDFGKMNYDEILMSLK